MTLRNALVAASRRCSWSRACSSRILPHGSGQPDFGPNVIIFDPSMPTSQIQATVDAIAGHQIPNQFGSERYALLFKPGTYGSAAEPLIVQVGYYTEVAGLGQSPGDVVIVGHIDVYNQCGDGGCFALVNFWRSLSNLTIQVTGLADCRASANFWAVSQAAPMRRVNVVGGTLSLMDYCTAGPQFASGGFIADSRTGAVVNGSQQQFLVRDSVIGSWSNAVWNQVFAGAAGRPRAVVPEPDLHDAGHEPDQPRAAVPLPRRVRPLSRLRPRPAHRLLRDDVGRRRHAGPLLVASASSTSPARPTRPRRSIASSRAART